MTKGTSGSLATTCFERRNADVLMIANIVAFEIGWLSSVVGGARAMPWLGPLTVMLVLVFHLRAARNPFEEVLLVLSCALIGTAFDSFLVATGWVSYSSGLFSDNFAPYWIITMWMLFATTLNVSMRWLRRRQKLAALFGFYGGPAAYIAGHQIGGIVLIEPVAALLALAIGWAAMMPLLMWLSENLDGMPGRRRNWVAASR